MLSKIYYSKEISIDIVIAIPPQLSFIKTKKSTLISQESA